MGRERQSTGKATGDRPFHAFLVGHTTFCGHPLCPSAGLVLGSRGDSDVEGGGSADALGTKIHGKFFIRAVSSRSEHFWSPSTMPFMKILDRTLPTRTPTSAGVTLMKVFLRTAAQTERESLEPMMAASRQVRSAMRLSWCRSTWPPRCYWGPALGSLYLGGAGSGGGDLGRGLPAGPRLC